MAGVGITFEGLDAIQRGLRETPEMTRRELLAAMTEATGLVQHEAMDTYPRTTERRVYPGSKRTPKTLPHTWTTIGSDAFATPLGVEGWVGTSAMVATFVELGTRPHEIKPRPVPNGAKALSIPVAGGFLPRKKVHHPGTQPQHFFSRTLAALEGQVVGIFEDAAGRIGEQMLGSGA